MVKNAGKICHGLAPKMARTYILPIARSRGRVNLRALISDLKVSLRNQRNNVFQSPRALGREDTLQGIGNLGNFGCRHPTC
jgi:hypothetical protein